MAWRFRRARYGQTGCYDAGAVQTEYALSFTTQPGNVQVGSTMSPSPTVLLTENGASFSVSLPTIKLTDLDSALTAGGSAMSSSGVASFTGLTFGTCGDC